VVIGRRGRELIVDGVTLILLIVILTSIYAHHRDQLLGYG